MIVWQDAGSDQEFDANTDGWYAQVLPVELKFEMKDGLKTSYRFCFLLVPFSPMGL